MPQSDPAMPSEDEDFDATSDNYSFEDNEVNQEQQTETPPEDWSPEEHHDTPEVQTDEHTDSADPQTEEATSDLQSNTQNNDESNTDQDTTEVSEDTHADDGHDTNNEPPEATSEQSNEETEPVTTEESDANPEESAETEAPEDSPAIADVPETPEESPESTSPPVPSPVFSPRPRFSDISAPAPKPASFVQRPDATAAVPETATSESAPLAAVALETPSKSKKASKKLPFSAHFVIETILIIAVVLLGLWVWSLKSDNHVLVNQVSSLNADPQQVIQRQTDALITNVGKLMKLPTNETPTIAAVSNAAQAKEQSAFFDNAENGDKVLMYVKAGEAILYRPTTNQIILVAPLTFTNPATTKAATTTPATTTDR